jgi:hypothetical protein
LGPDPRKIKNADPGPGPNPRKKMFRPGPKPGRVRARARVWACPQLPSSTARPRNSVTPLCFCFDRNFEIKDCRELNDVLN